jgi:hypothetical protein
LIRRNAYGQSQKRRHCYEGEQRKADSLHISYVGMGCKYAKCKNTAT